MALNENSKERIVTLSNILSLSRIFLLVPIIYCLAEGNHHPEYNLYALGLMLLGAMTDMLDGWLARRMKQVTNFGRIIDPIADKIGVGAVLIFLAITRPDFPMWYLWIVLLRDAVIFCIGSYIRVKYRHIFESNMIGKIAVTTIFFVIFLTVLNGIYQLNILLQFFIGISLAFISASMLSYALRLSEFYKKLKTAKRNKP
jgi:cardiolipin synthase (CMP-forming)